MTARAPAAYSHVICRGGPDDGYFCVVALDPERLPTTALDRDGIYRRHIHSVIGRVGTVIYQWEPLHPRPTDRAAPAPVDVEDIAFHWEEGGTGA